jgi:hypothetical protein
MICLQADPQSTRVLHCEQKCHLLSNQTDDAVSDSALLLYARNPSIAESYDKPISVAKGVFSRREGHIYYNRSKVQHCLMSNNVICFLYHIFIARHRFE